MASQARADNFHSLDLAKVVNLISDDWDLESFGSDSWLYYTLAESFVDFLLMNPKGRRVLLRISKRVSAGEGKRPLLDSREIKTYESLWRDHLADLFERDS